MMVFVAVGHVFDTGRVSGILGVSDTREGAEAILRRESPYGAGRVQEAEVETV